MIRASRYGLLVYPICPESAPHGWTQSIVREHVLAWANRRPHGTYTVDKTVARHHALVTIQGWIIDGGNHQRFRARQHWLDSLIVHLLNLIALPLIIWA